MDSDRFDRLAKTLAAAGTRRSLIRLLSAVPLGAVLAAVLGDGPSATAKDDDHGSSGRRHRRKAKHRHQTGNNKEHRKGQRKGKDTGKRKPATPGCTPTTCAAQSKTCGSIPDGCGNQVRCGPDSCGDGYTCTDNRCLCADGTAVCEGVCCETGQVCENGDGPCCTRVNPCGATSCDGVTDTCGVTVDCGACPSGTCCTGTCASACQQGADVGSTTCTCNGTCCRPGCRCDSTTSGVACFDVSTIRSPGVACSAGCPVGSACNNASGQCVPMNCDPAPCPAGSVCSAGSCFALCSG